MAKATKKNETTKVTLELSDEEAEALKSVLLCEINWDTHSHGDVAKEVFGALDDPELG